MAGARCSAGCQAGAGPSQADSEGRRAWPEPLWTPWPQTVPPLSHSGRAEGLPRWVGLTVGFGLVSSGSGVFPT